MITIFRERKDAYTKNAVFRLYREEERKQMLEDKEQTVTDKIIEPEQFSNICLFPNTDLRG